MCKDKKIAIRPIDDQTKASKFEGRSFLSIWSQGEFSRESKKIKQRFDMVIKEEVIPPINVPAKFQRLS